MVSEQLSDREDLVENLESEPVCDYLLQHGVITKETYDDISQEEHPERNRALLRHLDTLHSTNAMALFINALRQSGQLDLASSLDFTKRIKPVHGTGYLQRDRYKGQVAIRIQVEAVKALVPKMELLDRVSVEDLSSSTGTHSVEISFSPSRRRHHCSYENMTLLESPDEGPHMHPHLIKEYAYAHDDDDDVIKPKKSCWCICFPSLFRCKKDSKFKKHNGSGRRDHTSQVTPPDISKYMNVVTSSPSTHKRRHEEHIAMNGKYYQNRRRGKHYKNESPNVPDIVQYKNSKNEVHFSSPDSLKSRHSGTSALIQGYRRDSNSMASSRSSMLPPPSPAKHAIYLEQGQPVSQKIELTEEWRGDGEVLDEKANKFYVLFDSAGNPHYTNLIKYFEQDRGTLVMSAHRRDTLVVMNICMTKDQLKRLQSDYGSGKLTKDIEERLVNMQVLNAVDAKEMRLSTIIDDSEFSQAEEELG